MTFHFGGRERRRCLEVLGLHDPVTEEEVKKAYRAAALKFHPDKNPNPDAKEKFQEANTAYNFLLKGDSYLEHALHDQDDFGLNAILRYLFPWLFEERPREGYNRQAASGGNYSHFGGDSPFSHVYEGRRYHQGTWYNSRHFDPGPAHRPTGASHRHSHGRQQYSFYYDDDDDDDDDEDSGRGGGQAGSRAETGGRGSVPQHGQFFQEQADRRGAKKRNRQARRAQRLVEDQAGREQSNSRAGHRQGAAATDAHTRPMSQTRREGTSRPSSTSPRSPSATRESRPEEQIPKKSKKQLQAEQRQREKEQAQLRLELEEMERVKKEKIEKKRAAEEEKERIERAQREEEERREQEEERKREEERRNQQEMDEKKRRERMEEEERVRKLMEEFDKSDFMDERGEFKSTDPDLVNVIRRGDMNSLGNARSSEHEEPVDSIHGFNTADLIRLQSEGGNSRQAAETSPGNGPGYDQRSPGYDQRSPGYDRHDGRDRPTRLGGDAGGTAGQNSWQKNHFRPEGENSEGRGRGYIQGQRPRFPGPSRKFQNQRGVAGQPVLFSHPPPPPFPRARTPLLHTPPPGYPLAVWATPPPPVWAGPPPAHHYPPQGFPGPRLPSFDFSHTPPPAQRAGHW